MLALVTKLCGILNQRIPASGRGQAEPRRQKDTFSRAWRSPDQARGGAMQHILSTIDPGTSVQHFFGQMNCEHT